MDTAQNQNPQPNQPPAPTFPPPAFPKPADPATPAVVAPKEETKTETPEAESPTTNTTPTDNSTDNKDNDYHQKLADELSKLDKIYDGEFTGSIATKDGSTKAVFLKEPPIDTPEFLKENHDQQLKSVESAGLVGFIPQKGLVIVKGESATKLYRFIHGTDKDRFGKSFETSVGTISYDFDKPDLKSLADLLGEGDPETLTSVDPWNQATKTTAEIGEMKRFVLREAKVEEVLKAAYETTSKLAQKAG